MKTRTVLVIACPIHLRVKKFDTWVDPEELAEAIIAKGEVVDYVIQPANCDRCQEKPPLFI